MFDDIIKTKKKKKKLFGFDDNWFDTEEEKKQFIKDLDEWQHGTKEPSPI